MNASNLGLVSNHSTCLASTGGWLVPPKEIATMSDPWRNTWRRFFLVVLPLAAMYSTGVSLGTVADDEQPDIAPVFCEHLIKSGYSYSYGLASADLDGDGDLDLTSSDTRNFKLYWFENDGQGRFTDHLIEDGDRLHVLGDITGDAITKSVVGDAINNRWFKTPRLERHMLGDINADDPRMRSLSRTSTGICTGTKTVGLPRKIRSGGGSRSPRRQSRVPMMWPQRTSTETEIWMSPSRPGD
jgi:hypothetical protein